jgi:hypothetical protein
VDQLVAISAREVASTEAQLTIHTSCRLRIKFFRILASDLENGRRAPLSRLPDKSLSLSVLRWFIAKEALATESSCTPALSNGSAQMLHSNAIDTADI